MNSIEYIFEKDEDHTNIPIPNRVYARIKQGLQCGEIIIKKVFERNYEQHKYSSSMFSDNYAVCYITNMSNVYFGKSCTTFFNKATTIAEFEYNSIKNNLPMDYRIAMKLREYRFRSKTAKDVAEELFDLFHVAKL